MNVTLPESLKEFVLQKVRSGRYATADAFVEELVRTEAEILERVNRGEPLPVDDRFDRRLEMLLEEAEQSGDYIEVTHEDFDAVEREALELLRQRRPS